MSYGLNIEMHKQVGTIMFLIFFSSMVFHSVRGCETQEEPRIGCELNGASVIGCKQTDLLHTNNAVIQLQTCATTCTIAVTLF